LVAVGGFAGGNVYNKGSDLFSKYENAMNDFVDFLGFINTQLHSRDLPRLECFIMPANFSSIVGEFMNMTIPKYCNTLVKNRYPNGHPDLLPNNMYPGNSQLHTTEGIEIKGYINNADIFYIYQNAEKIHSPSFLKQFKTKSKILQTTIF
jgi:hypothetical protein